MQLRPEEISKIIKDQIKHYDNQIVQTDVGTVLLVGDGIARVSGLENCMANELVRFSTGAYGMALNLEENSVAVVMLGDDAGIKEGDTVERTREVVSVPVGEALIPSRPRANAASRAPLPASSSVRAFPCRCRRASRRSTA